MCTSHLSASALMALSQDVAAGDDRAALQRGPGECPYPHATADGEPVRLTALLTQPYGRQEPAND